MKVSNFENQDEYIFVGIQENHHDLNRTDGFYIKQEKCGNRKSGMKKLLVLPLVFVSAAYALWKLVQSAPELPDDNEGHAERLKFPSKFEDLSKLSEILNRYKEDNLVYVLVLFSSAFLFKQTFAIPGSALLNILAGALFGVVIALPLVSVLTAIGATICYLLADFFGRSLVLKFFSKKLAMLRRKVRENESDLFYFLIFARLFPMSPNWLLNISSPVVGIPIRLFFPSVLIGLIPYNLVCVQAGSVLSEIHSFSEIFDLKTMGKLFFLALFVLLFALWSRRIKEKTIPK